MYSLQLDEILVNSHGLMQMREFQQIIATARRARLTLADLGTEPCLDAPE
jgi:hypothetical protein